MRKKELTTSQGGDFRANNSAGSGPALDPWHLYCMNLLRKDSALSLSG